jgi:hypothetical protein
MRCRSASPLVRFFEARGRLVIPRAIDHRIGAEAIDREREAAPQARRRTVT